MMIDDESRMLRHRTVGSREFHSRSKTWMPRFNHNEKTNPEPAYVLQLMVSN
jgi:hypothetical protein